jgi:sirohydrochlorin cobaltochelatase
MERVIVLAMHGAPPSDFPRREMAEFFSLHSRMEGAPASGRSALEDRYVELEEKMRNWPRTAENDQFWAASEALANHLSHVTACGVVVGFNEFCAPDLDTALDQAAMRGPTEVVVVTPMMTRGGSHAETEIPEAVRRSQERHPGVSMKYAWPFDGAAVAEFLAEQIGRLV